jgi:hypothetical protein
MSQGEKLAARATGEALTPCAKKPALRPATAITVAVGFAPRIAAILIKSAYTQNF